MKIFKRFRAIFTLGVLPKQSSSEKRDIIFTNQAIFVLLLSSFSIACANFIAGCYLRILVPSITFGCLLLTFPLQKNQAYFFGKFFAILFPFSAAIFSTILFGPLAKTQFYLGATLVLAMIIFQGFKQHLTIFSVHLLGIAGMQFWINNFQPIIPNQDSIGLGVFNLIFIACCVFITIAQFKVHYHTYEKKVIDLVHSVQENSQEIENRNQQIEYQANCLKAINYSLQKEMSEKELVQKQLLNSNEELERFAYVASHDLKEPLRTIGSFTQILQRQLANKLDTETKEYFDFVVDGVKRMSFLLEDLLALSRLNREFTVEPINLNNTLEIIHLNLRNLIADKNGQLVVASLPQITGNKTQINQLFQNLISNGFKFSGTNNPVVEISYEDLESHYQFKIKDNGIGILKKYQEQIFIIFKRLHTRDKYEGTGIGLAICKKVVKNHNGKIWLESEENKGTTMYFTIKKMPKPTKPKINPIEFAEAQ